MLLVEGLALILGADEVDLVEDELEDFVEEDDEKDEVEDLVDADDQDGDIEDSVEKGDQEVPEDDWSGQVKDS